MPDPDVRYMAYARSLIPLDDPTQPGNMGLEGFDEDGERRVFPTRGLAVAWLGRMFKKYERGSLAGWYHEGHVDREERRYDEAVPYWSEAHRWWFTPDDDRRASLSGEEAYA